MNRAITLSGRPHMTILAQWTAVLGPLSLSSVSALGCFRTGSRYRSTLAKGRTRTTPCAETRQRYTLVSVIYRSPSNGVLRTCVFHV